MLQVTNLGIHNNHVPVVKRERDFDGLSGRARRPFWDEILRFGNTRIPMKDHEQQRRDNPCNCA